MCVDPRAKMVINAIQRHVAETGTLLFLKNWDKIVWFIRNSKGVRLYHCPAERAENAASLFTQQVNLFNCSILNKCTFTDVSWFQIFLEQLVQLKNSLKTTLRSTLEESRQIETKDPFIRRCRKAVKNLIHGKRALFWGLVSILEATFFFFEV